MASELASMRAMSDSLDVYALHTPATTVRLALDSLSVLTQEEYTKASQGRSTDAEVISSQWVRPRIGVIEQTIGAAEHQLRVRTSERVNAATEATARAEQVAVASLLVSLILATLIAIWLIHSISGPVHDLEVGMHSVARGRLTYRLAVPPDRQDEFGRLSASYDSMVQRLAELDKLKAEFISVASHELKTPINVILGYVELFEVGIYGKLSDSQRDVCDTIAGQADTLTRLVRRLLDVSRFEAGGGKLECRQIQVAPTPRHIGIFLQRSSHATRGGLSYHSDRESARGGTLG